MIKLCYERITDVKRKRFCFPSRFSVESIQDTNAIFRLVKTIRIRFHIVSELIQSIIWLFSSLHHRLYS